MSKPHPPEFRHRGSLKFRLESFLKGVALYRYKRKTHLYYNFGCHNREARHGTWRLSWNAEQEAWTTIDIVYVDKYDCMTGQLKAA